MPGRPSQRPKLTPCTSRPTPRPQPRSASSTRASGAATLTSAPTSTRPSATTPSPVSQGLPPRRTTGERLLELCCAVLLYDIAWLAAADRPTNNEALNSDRPTTPQIHTFAAAGCCRRYHGTHTSGIFGAVWNNAAQTMNTGTAGVGTPRNLGVKPISCKFLGSAGTGYMSNAIICLNWCYSQGARITSNSWGNAAYSQVRAERGALGGGTRVLWVQAGGPQDHHQLIWEKNATYLKAWVWSGRGSGKAWVARILVCRDDQHVVRKHAGNVSSIKACSSSLGTKGRSHLMRRLCTMSWRRTAACCTCFPQATTLPTWTPPSPVLSTTLPRTPPPCPTCWSSGPSASLAHHRGYSSTVREGEGR